MNTKLYVRKDVGTGKVVVLLHGLFGDGTQWEKITSLLVNSGHRVITLDLLGHGKSPKPKNSEFNAKENVSALRNALQEINATNNITIVGYSMGGAVALSYCAKYKDSANQLIIISTPFYLKPEQMLLAKYSVSVFITKMSGYMYSMVNKMLKPGKPLAKLMHYTDNSKTFHKMVGAYDNKLDPRVVRKSISNLVHNYDFALELSKVTIPVSFYCGKKDSFIVQDQLYALKKFNPYMKIQRLDIIKVDHMLVQNLPKEISSIIISNEQTKLNVSLDTKNGDPLVFLHGIESSSSYWQSIIPSLKNNNRIICLDLLGHGKSPKPKNIAYSIDDHVSYLHNTIISLNLKKFTIVGHSLGAIIALAYASKYPKEVSKLLLISPVFKHNNVKPRRFLVSNMNIIKVISDNGQLHPQVAQAIGDKQLNKLIPTFRTIESTIQKQTPIEWAKNIPDIPVKIIYGTLDPLVDENIIVSVSKTLKNASITKINGQGHNIILTKPKLLLDYIQPSIQHSNKAIEPQVIPKNFLKQVAVLAVPNLFIKSIFYLTFGVLLLTNLAVGVITIGLSAVVINKSYKLIKGAFSLKNEGLAYISYLLLAIFIALVAYGLLKHPEISAKIALYILCISIIIAGLLRLMAAIFWTKPSFLKKSLILSGTTMLVVGIAALLGGIYSTYAIIIGLAVYLIYKGVLYGTYSVSILFVAFVRGYNK